MQQMGVNLDDIVGMAGGGGGGAKKGKMTQEEYEATKPDEMRKDIRMISGCDDHQTSADVSNVASFQLPDPAGVTAMLLYVCIFRKNRTQHNRFFLFAHQIICRSSGRSVHFHSPQLSVCRREGS